MNALQRWLARRVLGIQTPETLDPPPHSFEPLADGRGPQMTDAARMYAMAVPNRFNQGFPSFNTSEDLELVSSLRNLRARARSLVRDAGYAKSAKRVIVNNVIGSGVRLQAAVRNSRGSYNDRINDGIEEAWHRWMRASNCHTGATLHFHDLERMCMGQVFEAGEIFLRIHRQKFGQSEVPIALEVVEPERIVDGYAMPSAISAKSGGVRLGIETDMFKRPLAYWIRDLHPGDIRLNLEQSDAVTRVEAADVIHLYICDRWPQTRGVPWIHAAAGKLQDVNGYSEAEIIAARGAASYLGTIESNESIATFGQKAPDNTFQASVEPGVWFKLQAGEKANFIAPNRPNAALDPFMRYMLREIAAAVGVSYEALSHDYSQSNYSSSRLSLLDERDVWKTLQQWWIRTFRERLHREWINAAVLSRAVQGIDLLQYGTDPEKYCEANFRPRGWSWVDPTKEVLAYQTAVKSGMKTLGDVITETGGGVDLEDVMKTRAAELEFMKELKLVFETSPEVYVAADTRGKMLIDDKGDVVVADVLTANAGGVAAQNTQPGTPAKDSQKSIAGADASTEGDGKSEKEARILRFIRKARRYM